MKTTVLEMEVCSSGVNKVTCQEPTRNALENGRKCGSQGKDGETHRRFSEW